MQVENKIFPYPILNRNKLYSNFQNSFFKIKFNDEVDEFAYTLKDVTFLTDSKLINDLFDSGKIIVYLIVECSDTVYRKAFRINKKPANIRLLKNNFTERVDISMFAIANENFKMSSKEFEKDYQDEQFEIEKYDILCADDGFNVRFTHDESESNLVKSIFSIVPNESNNDGTFEVDCEGKKIAIWMSNDNFKYMGVVNQVSTYKEVVFNMLLVPALIQALSLCIKTAQDEAQDLEEVGNKYIWFRSILMSYKRLYSKNMTIDEFKNKSPILLAQQLLGKPLGNALSKLHAELNKTEEEEN